MAGLRRFWPLTLPLLTASILPAQVAAPGDWSIAAENTHALSLPAGFPFDSLDLDYGASREIAGVDVDLNRDGKPDWLIRSAPSLCGSTGSCTYAIVDGATLRVLGYAGGNLIYIRTRRFNGWPVVQSWRQASPESGQYSTYVFDGAQYLTLVQVPVEGDGLQLLFRDLSQVPRGPPEARPPSN